MSGPKCLGYSIDPEVLRELRRRGAAADRCERLRTQLESLGVTTAPVPGGYWEAPSTEELERWNEAALADLLRAHGSSQAEELLQRLDGLDGTEVASCRRRLDEVAAGSAVLSDADVAAVEHACAAAESAFEQRYVASKIEEAFSEAGLTVGASFATHVADGNEAYAAASSSDAHAVGVRMDGGRLDLRVVRSAGQPDATLDAETEREFCKDLGSISASLHRAGVALDVISHQQPGTVPVAVVPDARPAAPARHGRRTAGGGDTASRGRAASGKRTTGRRGTPSGNRTTGGDRAGRRSRRRREADRPLRRPTPGTGARQRADRR